MIVELTSCALIIIGLVMIVRHYWITRRQPVRQDAPTGSDPWIRRDFWRD